jgi:hypothetical protein
VIIIFHYQESLASGSQLLKYSFLNFVLFKTFPHPYLHDQKGAMSHINVLWYTVPPLHLILLPAWISFSVTASSRTGINMCYFIAIYYPNLQVEETKIPLKQTFIPVSLGKKVTHFHIIVYLIHYPLSIRTICVLLCNRMWEEHVSKQKWNGSLLMKGCKSNKLLNMNTLNTGSHFSLFLSKNCEILLYALCFMHT